MDATRRPVIGILSEPLRGDAYKPKEHFYDLQGDLVHNREEATATYVPKAHV